VVGDRGYRLSGGESSGWRSPGCCFKAPSVVVLDEATGHLDSESEVAVQRALKTALCGRTSLVIRTGLSTIRSGPDLVSTTARSGAGPARGAAGGGGL